MRGDFVMEKEIGDLSGHASESEKVELPLEPETNEFASSSLMPYDLMLVWIRGGKSVSIHLFSVKWAARPGFEVEAKSSADFVDPCSGAEGPAGTQRTRPARRLGCSHD
jgi:hypothetical protein